MTDLRLSYVIRNILATQAGSVGFEKFNVLNSQVCIPS